MFVEMEIPKRRGSRKRTAALTPDEQYAQLEDGGEIFSHRIKACSGTGWFRPDNPSIIHHEATQLRIAVDDANVWLVVFAWFGDFRKLFYVRDSNINTNLRQPILNAVADPEPEQCVRLNMTITDRAAEYPSEDAFLAHLFERYRELSHLEKGSVYSHDATTILDSNYLQQEIRDDDGTDRGYTLSANQVAAYWCVEKGLLSKRPNANRMYKSTLMNMQISAGRRRFPLVYEPQPPRDRKAYLKEYSAKWREKQKAWRKEVCSSFSALVQR